MLKKTVASKPAIMIVDNQREISYERTCDICGEKITGPFYRLFLMSLENPKRDWCYDICSKCHHTGAHIAKYPASNYSCWAIKKFVNVKDEIETDPEYDYGESNWFDDDPETEYIKGEHNEAVTNFIEFVKKTAESLGILKNQGRYQWR